MSYHVDFTSTALEDIERLKKSGDKKVLRKIEQLYLELREHPRTGIGKPELLKAEYSGYYSRRISRKHRLIYSVNDDCVTVVIISAADHYDDN